MIEPEVPIPARMQHLKLDRRGLPIPFFAFIDTDGKPHFDVMNTDHILRCLKEDLCSLCGNKLTNGRWFVGGPKSAFHPMGIYYDPPMHDECVHYALQVCPYMSAPSYSNRIDGNRLNEKNMPEGMTVKQLPSSDARPYVFVAIRTEGHDTVQTSDGTLGMVGRRPYRHIEFWREGEKLDIDHGAELIRKHDEELARMLHLL